MIYSINKFEYKLNSLLQRNITIKLNDKVLKEGKVVLLSIKNYYLIFSLSQNVKSSRLSTYELPLPFLYECVSDSFVLSYKIKHFHQDDNEIKVPLSIIGKAKPHKIYDKEVDD